MGNIEAFMKEKLIIGVMFTEKYSPETIISLLEEAFGPADFVSAVMDFNFTDYYTDEMGPEVKRMIISFAEPVFPDMLADIKIRTNTLESNFIDQSREGCNRLVNLDPGLLSYKHLVLASTKNNGHRIALRDGIYAELTLLYYSGEWHELFWTYPDYRSSEYKEILKKIRELYKKTLKQPE
jgi:hypothetical protein